MFDTRCHLPDDFAFQSFLHHRHQIPSRTHHLHQYLDAILCLEWTVRFRQKTNRQSTSPQLIGSGIERYAQPHRPLCILPVDRVANLGRQRLHLRRQRHDAFGKLAVDLTRLRGDRRTALSDCPTAVALLSVLAGVKDWFNFYSLALARSPLFGRRP